MVTVCSPFPERDVSVQRTFGGMLYCVVTTAQRGLLTLSSFVMRSFSASLVIARSEWKEGEGVLFPTPRRDNTCASRVPRSSILLFAVTPPTLGMNDWPLLVCAASQSANEINPSSVPKKSPPISSHFSVALDIDVNPSRAVPRRSRREGFTWEIPHPVALFPLSP